MKDEEIIKALECLTGAQIYCRECVYSEAERHYPACKQHCATDALDLINRQKAEIEMLQSSLIEGRTAVEKKQYVIEKMNDEITWLLKREKNTRAEAIKEFAKKLMARLFKRFTPRFVFEAIKETQKEMVGEHDV